MSVLSFIEKLRNEPRYIRERYTFAAAGLVTLMVASIWLLSLPAKFGELSQQANVEESAEKTAEASGLRNFLDKTWAKISNGADTEETPVETGIPKTNTLDLTPKPSARPKTSDSPSTVLIGTSSVPSD